MLPPKTRVLSAWLALVLTGQASLAPASVAPTNLKRLSLEELMELKVVTATQTAADPFTLPFMVRALTAADFSREAPVSLSGALSEVPGVMVQKTANGQQSPYLRGFTGFRTLLLIDGIRLNNSVFRDGPNQYWSTVDPYAVAQLEVVLGPASVLYGSDSIGGTVNVLTVAPELTGPAASGRLYTRIASAERATSVRAEGTARLTDKFGALAGVTLARHGDLEGGAHVGSQPRTAYDEHGGDVKLVGQLQPGVRLVFAHQSFVQNDVWRNHSTIYGQAWEGTVPGTDLRRSLDQTRHLTYVQVQAKELGRWIEDATFSFSRQEQNEEQFRIRSDSRSDRQGITAASLGLFATLHSTSPLGYWTYGGSWYRDNVDSFARRYTAAGALERIDVQGPVADASTYDLAGLFVQNQLTAIGPIDITVRGRYDRAHAALGRTLDPATGGAAPSFSKSWDSLVGSVRATWRHSPEGKALAFAGLSQGFRAPNLSDLSRFDTAASGQIEVPAQMVRPEKFLMQDVGFKLRTRQLELEAAYFYTKIDGMIVRTPTGRLLGGLTEVTKRNSGDGFVEGAELLARLPLGAGFLVSTSGAWMHGNLSLYPGNDLARRIREPVSRLMPLSGRLALRWTAPSQRGWLEASAVSAARQDRLSSADLADRERIPPRGTPGYCAFTLRGGMKLGANTDVTLAVENLTDIDYRIHGSGINEPGRNFIFSGTVRF
ncbi:MAG: TonB-dependent receptor [Opitutae bacterium]|nr:TonB-dependent receptor [Opitutae bacterium]